MDIPGQDEILIALLRVAEENKWDKRQLANALGIPMDSVRKWFSPHSSRRPAGENLRRVREFLGGPCTQKAPVALLWDQVVSWWTEQHRFPTVDALAEAIGWTSTALLECLQGKASPPRLVVERVAFEAGLRKPDALGAAELRRRVRRLHRLLELLGDDLGWFRDANVEGRNLLRASLNFKDVGYYATLLMSLAEEEHFQRWSALTTYKPRESSC